MKKAGLILVVLLILRLLSAGEYIPIQPNGQGFQTSIIESTPEKTVVRVTVFGFEKSEIVHDGTTFHKIVISQMGNSVREGYPELPQRVELIGITPTGSYQARLLSVQYREFSDIYVYPAQPQPTREQEQLPWKFNHEVYQQNSWYPASHVRLEDPAILRDYRVLPVVFQPIQFNPAEHKIRVASEMVVEIVRSGHTGVNELSGNKAEESPAFRPLYQNFILNYSQIRQEKTFGIQGLPNMLIITYDNFYNQVLPFARWKNQKGVQTTVIKLTDIAPSPTANQIKSFIQSYYNNASDKPDYLLIVGDVEFVPWFDVAGSKTDLPYYLLVGNDILPDISGGRISVKTTTEAERVFTKLIRYEKTPYLTDPNWFHSALVINSNDFQDPIAGQWATSHFTNYGYNPVHHLGDDLGNATVANVMSAVNNGVSYIYYIGHGYPQGWSTTGFSTTNVTQLSNGEMQPVISSVACNNADLDDPSDCFAEVWLKHSENNGSVGIMAFTESCAAYPPDTLARGMVRAILSDTITAFGNIVDFGRLHMYQSYGSNCSATMHQSLLVGEPELEVWTRTPEAITVTAPPAAFFNIPFTVQVTNAQGPVAGALVCYWDTLGHVIRGYTDANGEITVNHGVAQPVQGLITVTGHNLIPVQQSISILPPQGPYVMVRDLSVVDTSGNSNGVAEAGETLSFGLLLENIGVDPTDTLQITISSSDSFLTIQDSTLSLQAIQPGDSVMSSGFQISISPNCPHLHQASLTVTIASGDSNNWVHQRFFTVHEGAHMALGADSLTFPPTYLNATSSQVLQISNSGPDTLFIHQVVSNMAQFTVMPGNLTIPPMSQGTLQIHFTPDTTQTYSGTLLIFSSDVMSLVDTLKVTGTGVYAPDISYPDSIPVYAMVTDSVVRTLHLENNGLGELQFTVQVSGQVHRGSGGADNFGHIWIDSDEPSGPSFNWIDISTTGTQLNLTGNNAISSSQAIGFDFPFYGNTYAQLQICTNGWASFTSYSVSYNNFSLPNVLAPRNLLAPLWDDLLFTSDSHVYVENQSNRFVVMYQNVYTVTGGGPYTFEIVLYDNGNIVFQYLNLDSLEHSYTVGIQNQDAQDGLTIAYNQPYLHDSLAVLISKHSWLTVEPLSGVIPAQSSLDLTLTIKTHNFPVGEFFASVQIESNDPDEPVVYVPVHLTVGTTALEDAPENQITTLQLRQNYPNPFNPTTTITYALPSRQEVEISVYNLLGQKVTTLYRGIQSAGVHKLKWDGKNLQGVPVSSGIYIYKLKTRKHTLVRKMIFLK